MSIVDIQRRIVEAGRIRIGQLVPSSNGRSRPEKLDTFRLTSIDRRRIEQAAELFGGEPKEWTAPAGKQWEVLTTTDSLDVVVPPSDLAFSQHYEMWSAGGCQRRCDGATESLSEGPCLCDPADRECDIHTRLSVLLRDLPGLGTWRLDTSGWYAAGELAGAVYYLQSAMSRGTLLPARLRLDQRSVKRPGANGKPQTLRYAVPVLDIEITPGQLLVGAQQPLALSTSEAGPGFTPVPEGGPSWVGSIAEQSEAPAVRPRRSNAAPEIPASGRSRRTRAAAEPPTEQPAQADDSQAPETPARADVGMPPAPASPPTRPRRASTPAAQAPARAGDPEYWTRRVHAEATKKGLEHDDVRLIAAAVIGEDPETLTLADDDPQRFSVKALVDEAWQELYALVEALPTAGKDVDGDLDAISAWVWPRAASKQLADWGAINVLACAATGEADADDLTVAQWIAWTVRLLAGEYDAKADGA